MTPDKSGQKESHGLIMGCPILEVPQEERREMIKRYIRILLVDDDFTLVSLIRDLLTEKGYIADMAHSYGEAEEKLRLYRYQVVISDFIMPGKTGLDLLRLCRSSDYDTQFIIVTAFGSIENAVEALKQGAFHYLTKPLQIEELVIVLEKALEHGNLTARNEFLSRELRKKEEFYLESSSPPFRSLLENIEKVRKVDSTVLLEGETGTGKEVMARLIHKSSPRAEEDFVPINCGALPENLLESELFGFDKGAFTGAESPRMGKLEYADGGTLFLDEVEAMSPKAQVSLLRFLQEGEITRLGSNKKRRLNVRIIAATNKNLLQMCGNREFREDLYYRLSVFPLHVPPLRERREDIPGLAVWLLERLCHKFVHSRCVLSPEARETLLSYDWPGNIRELRNCLERALIITQGETIEADALFIGNRKNLPMKFDEIGVVPLKQLETAYIDWALEKLGGNKTRTAELLGITTRGLYYKLDR